MDSDRTPAVSVHLEGLQLQVFQRLQTQVAEHDEKIRSIFAHLSGPAGMLSGFSGSYESNHGSRALSAGSVEPARASIPPHLIFQQPELLLGPLNAALVALQQSLAQAVGLDCGVRDALKDLLPLLQSLASVMGETLSSSFPALESRVSEIEGFIGLCAMPGVRTALTKRLESLKLEVDRLSKVLPCEVFDSPGKDASPEKDASRKRNSSAAGLLADTEPFAVSAPAHVSSASDMASVAPPRPLSSGALEVLHLCGEFTDMLQDARDLVPRLNLLAGLEPPAALSELSRILRSLEALERQAKVTPLVGDSVPEVRDRIFYLIDLLQAPSAFAD